MRWLRKDVRKASIAIAGMMLLVFIACVPVSAFGSYERPSEPTTSITGTIQASPTIDPTIVAATAKEY